MLAPVCKSNAVQHTGVNGCWFLSLNCSEAHHKQNCFDIPMSLLPFLTVAKVNFMQGKMSTLQKPVLLAYSSPLLILSFLFVCCLFVVFFLSKDSS